MKELKDFQQLLDLREKASERQSNWLRQILTLASGGLALLVGIGPRIPANIGSIGTYMLACTWVCLGLGIIFGGAATYLEVDLAKRLAADFHTQLRRNLEDQTPLKPNVVNPHKFFVWSRTGMVVSLLLAVFCLVSFSVLATLSR